MTKLILIKDVDGVGTAGDVVEVSDGYARNFLVPKHLAVKASAGALKNAEDAKKAREETTKRLRAEAEAVATQLVGTRVVIAAQSGDEGKLFGSIGIARSMAWQRSAYCFLLACLDSWSVAISTSLIGPAAR